MFKLTDIRPAGREYTFAGFSFIVDNNFKIALQVIEAMNDTELNDLDKLGVTMAFLSGNETFMDVDFLYTLEEAEIKEFSDLAGDCLEDLFGNLEENMEYDLMGNPMPRKEKEKTYDFTWDAEYIYASFRQAYDIDLLKAEMTWAEFKALFQGLPDDTIIKKIIDIRARELPTGKGTHKERKALIESKKAYALPGSKYDTDREEAD